MLGYPAALRQVVRLGLENDFGSTTYWAAQPAAMMTLFDLVVPLVK